MINSQQQTDAESISDQSPPFDLLYEQYVNKVYRKCLAITKDSNTAQDYTHDIFVKVLLKLESFQNRSSFSTWLYSIAHNHCLDQIRIQKRLSPESLTEQIALSLPEVQSSGSLDERMQNLESVLTELPAEDVQLLRFKHELGLSIQTLSKQFNLTPSAVKMRLKRTRDKIQLLYKIRTC